MKWITANETERFVETRFRKSVTDNQQKDLANEAKEWQHATELLQDETFLVLLARQVQRCSGPVCFK